MLKQQAGLTKMGRMESGYLRSLPFNEGANLL